MTFENVLVLPAADDPLDCFRREAMSLQRASPAGLRGARITYRQTAVFARSSEATILRLDKYKRPLWRHNGSP